MGSQTYPSKNRRIKCLIRVTIKLKKLLFIFRDPRRRGHSVEELYQGIMPLLRNKFLVSSYAFNDALGWQRNLRNIRDINPDIIHVTSDMYQYLPMMPGKKFMTLHDLGYFKGLQGWKKQAYKLFWLYMPVSRSEKVVSVSKYTKDEFLKVFGKKLTGKLKVIHNPVPELFDFTPKEFPSERPVILHVGTGTHKNLPTLIRALNDLPVTLHIVGKVQETDRRLLEEVNLTFQIFENLSYTEVLSRYKEADIISFISLHEGFGMPVIEGQAVGRPVITSSLCSLPEVGGEGALYINDPLNETEIRNAFTRMIEDKELRKDMVDKGLENVKRFAKQNIVNQYIEMYES